MAVAGGIEPVPLKMTGKLTYLTKLFGQREEIQYATRGQRAPTRKNQTRPLPDAGVSVKTSDAARWSDVLVYLSLGELARRSDDAPDD